MATYTLPHTRSTLCPGSRKALYIIIIISNDIIGSLPRDNDSTHDLAHPVPKPLGGMHISNPRLMQPALIPLPSSTCSSPLLGAKTQPHPAPEQTNSHRYVGAWLRHISMRALLFTGGKVQQGTARSC